MTHFTTLNMSSQPTTPELQTYAPSRAMPAAVAMVGSQSVTCIIPSYFVPHRSSEMWLVEYTKAGTWKKRDKMNTK